MIQASDVERLKRGPLDLEQRIEDLIKQKEYLQRQCRKAGEAILDQELKYNSLTKEFDKVIEENNNLKIMMGSKNAK